MRQLIGIRAILSEIQEHVFLKKDAPIPCHTHTRAHDDSLHPISSAPPTNPPSLLPTSVVHEDNSACQKFATTFKMTPRSRHIGAHYHFFRERVTNHEIVIVPISTDLMLADQLTKNLTIQKFAPMRDKLMGWLGDLALDH